jgi:CHASE2 domain-containing sensor protein
MKINRNPTVQEVRRFVFAWTLAAAVMGGLLFWRHHPLGARIVWTASIAAVLSGALLPSLARLFYRAWMGLVYGINFLITKLLLVFIFWGVLTPIALLFKLIGRDALMLKKSGASSGSYWREHDKITDMDSYRHLY